MRGYEQEDQDRLDYWIKKSVSLELQVKELETALEIWHELMREKNKEIADKLKSE